MTSPLWDLAGRLMFAVFHLAVLVAVVAWALLLLDAARAIAPEEVQAWERFFRRPWRLPWRR